ncbi:MAG TPA: class II fructose-bisphosphate aldolase [Candidatus Brocadiia bacterium]|nr:class II fructose-bisphosphate aldolase [Planctomycetota bacterium]MDO8094465.1 class II fructose-bisphosphate aldolase [Candidatus Brocadiales bacterium]
MQKCCETVVELRNYLKGVIEFQGNGNIKILNEDKFRTEKLDGMVSCSVFSKDTDILNLSRWLIRTAASKLGIKSSSIQGLYEAMGRKEYKGFTVPAINIRGLTYDVARSVVRAAKSNNVGALIFEIARSEIDYTNQRPAEYANVVTAAAIREKYQGPIFIQGDHFQINAKKYKSDANAEVDAVRSLIKEAVDAGFYNIDIDSSTLVDLSKPSVTEQQRLNFELAAELTSYIRKLEPKGITISVGGEIGEVGGKNSTEEELRAFMNGYRQTPALGGGLKGISKISIQTGTTHGGVPLPDGTIAKVKLDFDTLEKLSRIARDDYGMCGAVQHGASTLPPEAFDRFPKTGTAEVHLATEFQNMIYENEHFPKDLKDEIYEYLRKTCASEKKEGETDEQFIYKTRKKAFGPFKEKLWNLPSSTRDTISKNLEGKFDFLFKKLNVVNTRDTIAKTIKPVDVPVPPPSAIQM